MPDPEDPMLTLLKAIRGDVTTIRGDMNVLSRRSDMLEATGQPPT